MKTMRFVLYVSFLLLFSPLEAQEILPFRDVGLPIEKRIDDLISRLTVEEKASLMIHNTPGIERLGIPPYDWWNEALHGIARAGRATVFPQAIGLAATFDTELIEEVATVISTEGRAKYNEAKKLGNYGRYFGLTYWSPNVNLFRDPRWGRGQETYGEDPHLSGEIGKAFVRGLQGKDSKYLKTAAAAKHFIVHSGPEALRHEFNAITSQTDLYNTYLPAFKDLVEEGVAGVMCAYNRTNDELCCGSPTLLVDLLRNELDFDGYIVSDCWALNDFWQYHKVIEDDIHSAALAIENSVNVNCGTAFKKIPEAVEKGLISEKQLDNSLRGGLKILFRLGWFDEEDNTPWADLGEKDVANKEHKKLSRKTAAKSIVLLKNNGILPLKKGTKSIYVSGPNAMSHEALLANYNGFSSEIVTPVEGIISVAGAGVQVSFNKGCELTGEPKFSGLWIAGDHEVNIAVIGINSLLEGENGDATLSKYGGDKNDLKLPQVQIEYLKELHKKDVPLVVVVMGGSALSLSEIEPLADAILWAWYPGAQGGNALADILFGKENPGGRLPLTFYNKIADLPPFEDYTMAGKTYRYFEGGVLYPFGYGLSYTEFEYENFRLNKERYSASKDENIKLSFNLKNMGQLKGDEVIQVYLSTPNFEERPVKTLISFDRRELSAGKSENIEIEIPLKKLEWYNKKNGKYEIEKGLYNLEINKSANDVIRKMNFKVN